MSIRRQIGGFLSTYNLNSRFTKQLLEFAALHIGQYLMGCKNTSSIPEKSIVKKKKRKPINYFSFFIFNLSLSRSFRLLETGTLSPF